MKSPKGKGRKRSAAAARTAKPRAVDLLQAVRAHIEQQGIPRASDLPKRLSITRFGTVTVSRERVKMEHFTVPGAVNAPELARTVIEWAVRRLIETKRARFGPVPRGIEKYVDAINQSIATANWFGALFLALAMPDICGALEDPTEQVGVRYKRWFDRYMARWYAPELFSAADCYYLRCAALHQGLASHPQAQNERVVFITPPPGGSIFHSNFAQVADGSFVLQLQIDVFCAEICEGVMQWSNDVAGDQATQARIAELLEFYDPTTPLNLAP